MKKSPGVGGQLSFETDGIIDIPNRVFHANFTLSDKYTVDISYR